MVGKTGNISTDNNNSLANDAKRNVSRRVILSDNRFNTFKAVKTNVTTAATKIDVPEDATRIIIYHVDANETLWLGDNKNITAGGDGTAPIEPGLNKGVNLEVIKGNSNSIYGIVSADDIDVYAIGMVKE